MEILSQAERFIESQGFHLMTKEELWEMWTFNLKYFYSRALIYSDSTDCNGWTLWIPPGCKGVSIINFIRYGGIRMALKLGLPAMRRIMHYEDYSASVRLNATGGREWYGYNLAVRPEAQGQHLAGKLLCPMLEYCAQNGKQAYLETHSEKNVGIYRHFGFEVVSDG